MRTSYIFYKTATGKIEMQRELTEQQAMNTCNLNPGVACMQGYVIDINANKVDVSQDPPVIVSSTDNVFTRPAKVSCRELRNAYLKDSDWTVGADSPLSDAKKAEWTTYRQELRDFINGLDDDLATAEGLTWPTKPS